MVRIKDLNPRGLLNVPRAVQLARYWPSDDLAPFIEHYWIVRWNVPEAQIAETLPHPSVHMVLEKSRSDLVGVMRSRFTRMLEGAGRVVGTKFHPGGFRAFVDRPVAAFTDRRWPVADIFGDDRFAAEALSHADDHESVAIIETFLRSLRPHLEDAMTLCGRIVARIADDRGITRVDQIGIAPRQLQRLFREYVGVSPKWVIQRYRLIAAAQRLADGLPVDFAALALDLGYADQAHFIRDFKRLVGKAPAEYARSVR